MSDDLPTDWPTSEQRARVDSRSRALRARRRLTGAGAFALVVAMVAGGVVLTRGNSTGSGVRVAAVATTTSTQARPTLPFVSAPEPKGWRLVDFGDARIAVPPGWTDAEPSSPAPCSGLPAEGFRFFRPGGNCPSISIGPIGGSPLPPQPARTVHGIKLYEAGGGLAGITYAAPELGVALTVHDDEAKALLSTLTSSARRVVLGPGGAPPVPSDWRTITYGGFTLRVPPTLGVTHLDEFRMAPGQCSSVPFPEGGVFLGDGKPGAFHCPAIFFQVPVPTDAVWMHSKELDSSAHFGADVARIGKVLVAFRSGNPRDPVLELNVALKFDDIGQHGTLINLGLGPDPMIARTILYSIRPAS